MKLLTSFKGYKVYNTTSSTCDSERQILDWKRKIEPIAKESLTIPSRGVLCVKQSRLSGRAGAKSLILDKSHVSLSVKICPDAVSCQFSLDLDHLICLPFTLSNSWLLFIGNLYISSS